MSLITRSNVLKLLSRGYDKKRDILATAISSKQNLSFHATGVDDQSEINSILLGVQNRNISIEDAKKRLQQQMNERNKKKTVTDHGKSCSK